MIVIEGTSTIIFEEGTLSEDEQAIYQKKKSSPVEYPFACVDDLLFELKLRTQIMEASWALSKSGVFFAGFNNSVCNKAYWHHTDQGRFRLKSGVSPQAAIRDIFSHGNLYAFECSTAVVVVLYKALLESIDPEQFDWLFSDLLLFNWDYNANLHLIDRTCMEEAVPGDVLYFDNPEFAPILPWWRGENVVKMTDGLYYGHGHGIGVASEGDIITVLNKYRKPDSTQSAFLTDTIVFPDFSYFAKFQSNIRVKPIIAKVGDCTFVRPSQPFS
ncbi:protein-glutamine gamma-glutamyltransferase [Paenibacillus sp. SI8]|uniref:protein-glutamine gamma-glutamyltransferase n=1 Tax=unclassified Paenibacillus TaxID=185978 RepID=UPI003466E411